MHFDGSKMKNGLGAGIVVTSPKGDQLQYVLQIHFAASNNVAEYESLVHGIKLAKEIGIWNIVCFGDSDLMVQKCTGNWDAKDENMASYRFLVQQLSGFFEGCEFHHVPELRMKQQMHCQNWDPPEKRYQPECHWEIFTSHLSSLRQNQSQSSFR